MPVYTYICPLCGEIKESLQSMEDRFILQCDCGKLMERYWQADLPQIVGETCPGGVIYSGYDEGLDEVVVGPAHRRELMKRHGVHEYSPSQEWKQASEEAKYIRKHGGGSQEARKAVRKVHLQAGRKRKEKIVKQTFDKIKE